MMEARVWVVAPRDYEDPTPSVQVYLYRGESEEDLDQRYGRGWRVNPERGRFATKLEALRALVPALEEERDRLTREIEEAKAELEGESD